jgi:hypothetical protein
MSAQMTELEEVTMVDYSDDAFEATVAGVGGAYSAASTMGILCGGNC